MQQTHFHRENMVQFVIEDKELHAINRMSVTILRILLWGTCIT